MSLRKLDPLTLDEMVDGDVADPQSWGALIASPQASTVWREAISRRAKLDSLAKVLLGHPWLAKAIATVRSSARPQHVPNFIVDCWPRQALLGAVLGPSEAETGQVIHLSWGEMVTRPARLGETVHLRGGPAEAFYVIAITEHQRQILPTRSWELEPHEAPVLLMAVVGQLPSEPEWNLAKVEGYAGVILVEGSDEPG